MNVSPSTSMDDAPFRQRLSRASEGQERAENAFRRIHIGMLVFWGFVIVLFVTGIIIGFAVRELELVQPVAMAMVFAIAGFNVGVTWVFARVAKVLAAPGLRESPIDR